ncbi:hypothetical protein CRI94_06945 [Longibacter salinarum]|uniref:Uncharacterized protein n=1 Tax=Longibacter salinarum TaxID=1850348 RepID=A0A2A8CYI5_9BACT|nr:hypothetical protein [Longibacter salinarum]PEN13799.1 hypothetical protein CRI94_06945 [Longibacter salinarum]
MSATLDIDGWNELHPTGLRTASFTEAVTALRDVVASRGLNRQFEWVFREHVAFVKSRIFVRMPLPADTFHRSRALFEAKKKAGDLVPLAVLGTIRANTPTERTVCYIGGNCAGEPRSDAEGTQFRVPLHPTDGTVIRRPLLWSAVRFGERLSTTPMIARDLPSYAANDTDLAAL